MLLARDPLCQAELAPREQGEKRDSRDETTVFCPTYTQTSCPPVSFGPLS